MNQNGATADREGRLGEVLADWLEAAERGAPPEEGEYLRRYPEFAAELQRCFADWRRFPRPGGPAAPPSAAPGAPLPEGGVLGDFRILREVGRGGMGVVYEAEQVSLRRRVALKVLPMAAALDSRQLQRFQLEAHAAACLHHTNIVPVHAVGTEHGVPYYAMQFIEGQSLAELIRDLRRLEGMEPVDGPAQGLAGISTSTLAVELLTGHAPDAPTVDHSPSPARGEGRGEGAGSREVPVSATPRSRANSSTRSRAYVRTIANLGLQAAEALDHAHTRGILHRDIKPANLLLDPAGRLWVTDFGLAQIQGSNGLTLTGDVLGTLRYMSPEQALARRVVIDGRTDVYSLGVTLYELLALRPAIDGKDRQEILRRIAEQDPASLRTLNPAVPRELETIVAKAMDKEPSARYATARDLADDLRNYLEDRPIRARRPSLSDRARKWSRRHVAAVRAGIGVLLVLVASLGWIVRDVSARRAEAEGKVRESLAVLEPGLRQGNPHAADVVRAARQAEAHLAGGLVRRELRDQTGRLLADLAMLADLERIRLDQALLREEEFDRGTDSAYAAAFRSYGVDVESLGPAEAGTHLRDRAIAAHLAAGLDDWAIVRKKRGGKEDQGWRRLLDAAVQTVPEPNGWRAAFRAALAREMPREELVKLADAAPLGEMPATTLNLLGNHLREAGATETAVSVLRAGQRRYPGDFWLNHSLAFALFKLQLPQLDEAIGYARAALALRPESAMVHSNLGLVLKNKGRVDEALACYREAIRLKPDDGCAYNNLGIALKGQGKLDEALACYQEAVRFGPANHAEHHDNLGNALQASGRWDEAINCFKEAIRAQPELESAHNNLDAALRKQGKLDEVIAYYNGLLRLQPSYKGYEVLGIALFNKGRLDEAIARFRDGLRLRPDLARAHSNLGAGLANKGRLDEALAAFREAVRLQPDDSVALRNLSVTLKEKGCLDEAIAVYRDAIRLKPGSFEFHDLLGEALETQGKPEEAIAAYREAIRLQPAYYCGYIKLGIALGKQRKVNEAIACNQDAIRLQPDRPDAHNNLAGLLLDCQDAKIRDVPRAVALARKVTALEPKVWIGWHTLGDALYRAGDNAGARDAIRKSMELSNGGQASHWFLMATVDWKQGERHKARQWYDKAVDWMEKNQPKDEGLHRDRAEAEALMGLAELPADVFVRP
jgi:tetratricopeptide (TPR) repeat protein